MAHEEEVKKSYTKGSREDYTAKHPAFMMIGASRVSGHIRLAGSELVHQHYMTVKIARASKDRNLSRDWWHADMMPVIEIAMSEAQWASFVSSPNMGQGIPCTALYGPEEGSKLQKYPLIVEESSHRISVREMEERGKKVSEKLMKAVEQLGALAEGKSPIAKGKVADIVGILQSAVQDVVSNMPYHVKQHKELMEKNVHAAKSDVEGYVLGMITQLGLESLQSVAPQLNAPEGKEDDE